MKLFKLNILFSVIALVACGATEFLPAQRPASQAGDNQSKALIEQGIAAMLNQNSVLLADDVFVGTSEIVLERSPVTDSEGLRIQGRELQAPLHFRLWKRGEACYLEFVETEQMQEISGLSCTVNTAF